MVVVTDGEIRLCLGSILRFSLASFVQLDIPGHSSFMSVLH